MNVKLTSTFDDDEVESKIVAPSGILLPSLNEGWRFNFNKHAKKTSARVYVLVCEDSPDVVEGCLIFQMKNFVEPYLAYVEVAPHNKGRNRRFENVAGCLIAFACRLSFIDGEGHFKGWLAFDVKEASKEDEVKLMAVYCQKYGALRWGETTMVIPPEQGEVLITKYLTALI